MRYRLAVWLNRISILGFVRKCYISALHIPVWLDFLFYAPNMYIYIESSELNIGCSILFVWWCTNQNMIFDVTQLAFVSFLFYNIMLVSISRPLLDSLYSFTTRPTLYAHNTRLLSSPVIDLNYWIWFHHAFIRNPQDAVALDSFSIKISVSMWMKWIITVSHASLFQHVADASVKQCVAVAVGWCQL